MRLFCGSFKGKSLIFRRKFVCPLLLWSSFESKILIFRSLIFSHATVWSVLIKHRVFLWFKVFKNDRFRTLLKEDTFNTTSKRGKLIKSVPLTSITGCVAGEGLPELGLPLGGLPLPLATPPLTDPPPLPGVRVCRRCGGFSSESDDAFDSLISSSWSLSSSRVERLFEKLVFCFYLLEYWEFQQII